MDFALVAVPVGRQSFELVASPAFVVDSFDLVVLDFLLVLELGAALPFVV
jgi:hypothetical protein